MEDMLKDFLLGEHLLLIGNQVIVCFGKYLNLLICDFKINLHNSSIIVCTDMCSRVLEKIKLLIAFFIFLIAQDSTFNYTG